MKMKTQRIQVCGMFQATLRGKSFAIEEHVKKKGGSQKT